MDDCDNPEGLFFRRVGNQVFTDKNEAERPRSEVRTLVALIGKWNHSANPGKDFLAQAAGGKRVIFRDRIPRSRLYPAPQAGEAESPAPQSL